MKLSTFAALLAFSIVLTGGANAIDISNCGYTVNAAGNYDVTQNISQTGSGNCIQINASDVTLDCHNFTLSGDGYIPMASSGVGIKANAVTNVTIKNCTVTKFDNGIFLSSATSSKVLNNTVTSNKSSAAPATAVPGGIRIEGGSGNTISGNNASYNSAATPYGYGIGLFGSSNNFITGNTLLGRPTGLQGKGIYVYNASNNNTIESNNITGNDTGIFIASSSDNKILNGNTTTDSTKGIIISSSSGTIVDNYTSTSDHDAGISLTNASNTTITNSTISDAANYEIAFSASNATYCNNTLANVTGSNGSPIEYYHDGAFTIADKTLSELILCNADNSSISNIQINGVGGTLRAVLTDDASFSNITSSNNYRGMYFTSSNRNQISDSTTNANADTISPYSPGTFAGVFLGSSNDNTITNLTAKQNWNGIYIYNSSGNKIIGSGTNISDNAIGIYFRDSSNNTVSDATITNNKRITWPFPGIDTGRGIRIRNSSNNTISNSTLTGNTWGIYLSDNSTGNTLNDSIVSSNAEYGLYFVSSLNNKTTGNTICSNPQADVSCQNSEPQTSFAGNECNNVTGCGASVACTIACGAAVNQPPTATLMPDPQNGNEPLTVSFTGGCSDTDGTITRCIIDFGDGSATEPFTIGMTHIYATANSYTATLTATDNDGATGTANAQIDVTIPGVPQCSVTASPATIDTGGNTTASVAYSNFNVTPTADTIDCGDSATETALDCTANPCTFECQNYSSSGIITVKMKDGANTIDCGTATVTVNETTAPELSLLSMAINPSTITNIPAGGTTGNITVVIRNTGTATANNAIVDLVIINQQGAQKFTETKTQDIPNGTTSVTFAPQIDSTWTQGNYMATATLKDNDGNIIGYATAYLTIGQTSTAVPETNIVAIILIAFAAIGITYFSTKRK